VADQRADDAVIAGPRSPPRTTTRRSALLTGLMPKMKTHSGAKKRFELTAGGKVRARHAFSSHILEKKSAKYKRELGRPEILSNHDTPRVKTLLGAKKS